VPGELHEALGAQDTKQTICTFHFSMCVHVRVCVSVCIWIGIAHLKKELCSGPKASQ
jgi:hypothetical protein